MKVTVLRVVIAEEDEFCEVASTNGDDLKEYIDNWSGVSDCATKVVNVDYQGSFNYVNFDDCDSVEKRADHDGIEFTEADYHWHRDLWKEFAGYITHRVNNMARLDQTQFGDIPEQQREFIDRDGKSLAEYDVEEVLERGREYVEAYKCQCSNNVSPQEFYKYNLDPARREPKADDLLRD